MLGVILQRDLVVKHKMRFAVILGVLFVCIHSVNAGIKGRIDAIVKKNSKLDFSICVREAKTGRSIYQYRSQQPMIPASNMKIITSAAALHILGADYQFITRVGLSGDTLVVIGSGDPLLGDRESYDLNGHEDSTFLHDIAVKLGEIGVESINSIVVDSTVFEDQRAHPHWSPDDLNKDWACEVCGINYRGNCIDMTVSNRKGRISVLVDPRTSYVAIQNKVRSIRSGSGAVGAYRIAGRPNVLDVTGKCKTKQGPFEVAIEKPALYFGYRLAEYLGQQGISVNGKLLEKRYVDSENWRSLTEYRTPLAHCLYRCNKNSFNLAAESLLKTVSAYAQDGPGAGSWQHGSTAVSDYLRGLGINSGEFVIDDGSGLSRENRLSANTIVTVLHAVYHSPDWDFYKESLAVGGVDGTIGKDFKGQAYQGKFLGKTGYINRVRGFSGICYAEHNTYIFSILANNANYIRDVVNSIAKSIIDAETD